MRSDHDGHNIVCAYKLVATQTARAFSSVEAEFLAKVWHETRDAKFRFGSTRTLAASKGIASRVGFGKIRHWDAGLQMDTATHGSTKHSDPQCGDIGTKDVNVETPVKLMNAMNFEEMTGRHPRALKVVHDQGLNTFGNESMDEDKEINQVEHGRAGRMKLTLKDQLIKRKLMSYVRDLWKTF